MFQFQGGENASYHLRNQVYEIGWNLEAGKHAFTLDAYMHTMSRLSRLDLTEPSASTAESKDNGITAKTDGDSISTNLFSKANVKSAIIVWNQADTMDNMQRIYP